jgi:hypothetical protein
MALARKKSPYKKMTTAKSRYKQFGHLAYGKIGLYLEDLSTR